MLPSQIQTIYPGNVLGGAARYLGLTSGGLYEGASPLVKAELPGLRGLRLGDGSVILIDDVPDSLDLSDLLSEQPGVVPFGSLMPYAGTEAPEGWLICDGRLVSRTEYAALFDAIGTIYGVGDGSTTFAIPDLRERVPVGVSTALELGDTGGAAEVTLTEAEIPSHDHSVNPPSTTSGGQSATHQHNIDHTHLVNGSFIADVPTTAAGSRFRNTGSFATAGASVSNSGNASVGHTHDVDIAAFDSATAGGGGAHENMPPYLTLYWIVRAGLPGGVAAVELLY